MPFLDVMIIPNEDGSLSTTVYRKSTHTDLYLQWDGHHTVSSKYSVIGTLHHRAETICSSPQLLQQEEKYLQKALQRCKYPAWALNRVKIKSKGSANKKEKMPLKLVITTTRNHTWWYLIIEGWVRAWRKCAAGMECKSILKEAIPSRTSWWPQKTKIQSWRRVGSSIDTNVVGWIVMRNTLESPQGFLERGSRNIRRHPPQYLTILTPLVTVSPLIILV